MAVSLTALGFSFKLWLVDQEGANPKSGLEIKLVK